MFFSKVKSQAFVLSVIFVRFLFFSTNKFSSAISPPPSNDFLSRPFAQTKDISRCIHEHDILLGEGNLKPNMTFCKGNMVQDIPPRGGLLGPQKATFGGRSHVTLDMIRVLPSILKFLSLRTLVPHP